jgi:prophage antirepressor-like protein
MIALMEIVGEFKFCNRYFPIYGSIEEPLFLAVDVARAIDYSVGHTSHMIEQVDPDEKVLIRRNSANQTNKKGGVRKPVWFLTENGVYEVLFQSRKPVAKAFKKVVKDMLRDIREKRGGSFDWLDEEMAKHAMDPETGLYRPIDIYGDFIDEEEG